MTSCLLRIHSLRFFDGGLHEVPVEEVMTVALIAIFIFVPCLWLVRYLKDKRLDSDEKDKFIPGDTILVLGDTKNIQKCFHI